jgi:hypothetical protein
VKSQSISYLLNESEHIYWILDLGDEMHSIWDLWISGLQERKDKGFFGSHAGPENPGFFVGQWSLTENSSPERQVGGGISSSVITTLLGQTCQLQIWSLNYSSWCIFVFYSIRSALEV